MFELAAEGQSSLQHVIFKNLKRDEDKYDDVRMDDLDPKRELSATMMATDDLRLRHHHPKADTSLFRARRSVTNGRITLSHCLAKPFSTTKNCTMRLCTTILLLLLAPSAEAFSVPGLRSQALRSSVRVSESSLSTSASTSIGTPSDDRPVLSKKEAKKKALFALAKKEGGPFTFNTKFGALNPFAIYYGLVSIFLGIPWFIALNACQLLYFITGGRIDRQRRLPVFLSHVWGVTLMRLTRCTPEIENKDVLDKFFKEKRPAMFVANHNSWMDIPFLGYTVGWRNYKLVSKAELGKVPILGRSIKVGGHIMVDRANRKSQLKTLKKGIQYLKVSVLMHQGAGCVID